METDTLTLMTQLIEESDNIVHIFTKDGKLTIVGDTSMDDKLLFDILASAAEHVAFSLVDKPDGTMLQ